MPVPPPHSVWDYRWTSGACQDRAGDSSFGPSPPHSLQTRAVGHILPPALGTPRPAAGPASPMSERRGSHLMKGRGCHGDPQTEPNSWLQAQAPLWTKPSEHLLQASPWGPGGLHSHALGTLSPCSHQGAAQCWGRIQPFPLQRKAGGAAQLMLSQPWGTGWAVQGGSAGAQGLHTHASSSRAQCRHPVLVEAAAQLLSTESICHPIAPVQAGPTGAKISASR